MKDQKIEGIWILQSEWHYLPSERTMAIIQQHSGNREIFRGGGRKSDQIFGYTQQASTTG